VKAFGISQYIPNIQIPNAEACEKNSAFLELFLQTGRRIPEKRRVEGFGGQ
jgi:hypothetical protein